MKTDEYVIVSVLEVEIDQIELFKLEVNKITQMIHSNVNCTKYQFYQDVNNKFVFILFEIWKSHELWQSWINSTEVELFFEHITSGVVSSFEINEEWSVRDWMYIINSHCTPVDQFISLANTTHTD